jgi:hypothetical protein
MIKGKIRIDLTAENILKMITEYDIFMFYMPDKNWKLNEATNSPFREDRNPSFLIGNKNGYLSFMDFGDSSKHGDCFAFVKTLHGCTYDDALRLIDKDFGLGICNSSNIGEYKKIVSTYKQPEDCKEKHYSMIQVITRKFTKEELAYWNEYYQDITDLRREHVYSIEKVFLNRKRFPLSNTELRFGYLYDGKWKIYRPFAGKKSKWVPSNVPITAMDGKENIVNCDTVFINKSKKDHMVIHKLLHCSCAVQHEGLAPFSDENVKFLKDNSRRQILSFDSDIPGVSNSQQITKLFDFGYCNVPRKYLTEDIKDWAGLARQYGLKVIEDYLKERKIL